MTVKKLVPANMGVLVEAFPPGAHPKGSPIKPDLWCVKVHTVSANQRWFGFLDARINSALRMEVTLAPGQERSEVLMAWEDPY